MLFRSVFALPTCPQTFCIHRCFGTRPGPATGFPSDSRREPKGLVRPRPPPVFFLEPRVFLGQVPPGGDVVVPMAIPIDLRGKAARLRSRVCSRPSCKERNKLLSPISMHLPK